MNLTERINQKKQDLVFWERKLQREGSDYAIRKIRALKRELDDLEFQQRERVLK